MGHWPRARDAGMAVPAATAHHGRLRAAMIRDVAALLGIPPEYIMVTDDPARSYGAMPGQFDHRAGPRRPG